MSSCPTNLYFGLPRSSTSGSNYSLTGNDADYRRSNVCYLCHKYCKRCDDYNDNSDCTHCAATYYHWIHSDYGERCNYFCNEGNYGNRKGEFVASTSVTDRACYQCDDGCNYCAGTASYCLGKNGMITLHPDGSVAAKNHQNG